MKSIIFQDVKLYNLIEVYQCFREMVSLFMVKEDAEQVNE
jgi:hypothetical protein